MDGIKDITVSKPLPITKPFDERELRTLAASIFIILFYFFFWGVFFPTSPTPSFVAKLLSVSAIANLICINWVYNIAKRLNRNTLGWSFFALLFLPIALIIIGCLRKREKVS